MALGVRHGGVNLSLAAVWVLSSEARPGPRILAGWASHVRGIAGLGNWRRSFPEASREREIYCIVFGAALGGPPDILLRLSSCGQNLDQFGFFFVPPPSFLETINMGEWKAQISLRVRQDLRRKLEGVAERERRKLGNVTEVLLESGVLQLRVAGSLERLLKVQLASKRVEL